MYISRPRLPILGPVLFVMAFAGIASAQTADEIVEKHLAAVGGRDALGKLTSRHSTGTATVSTPGGDVSGPIEVFTKTPNKTHVLMKLDLRAVGGAGEMTIEQRFDGTSGVMTIPTQGDTPITGNQLENLRNTSFPSPLLHYKEAGTKLELVANQKLADKDVIVLVLTPKSGPAMRLFLDPTTYLVLRTITTMDLPQGGGTGEQTSDVSDYRTVDGVKVPFEIAIVNPVQTIKLVFTSIENNVPIDDAVFTKK